MKVRSLGTKENEQKLEKKEKIWSWKYIEIIKEVSGSGFYRRGIWETRSPGTIASRHEKVMKLKNNKTIKNNFLETI